MVVRKYREKKRERKKSDAKVLVWLGKSEFQRFGKSRSGVEKAA
jgi:hypothetical protein